MLCVAQDRLVFNLGLDDFAQRHWNLAFETALNKRGVEVPSKFCFIYALLRFLLGSAYLCIQEASGMAVAARTTISAVPAERINTLEFESLGHEMWRALRSTDVHDLHGLMFNVSLCGYQLQHHCPDTPHAGTFSWTFKWSFVGDGHS